MQLYTHTTAFNIEPSSRRGNWRIETTRGPVECDEIFHATNGYASNLLPEFIRKIAPVKGNVLAIHPCQHYSSHPLTHTYGVQWGEDFDYMIQRPTDGQPLIFGGGDLAHTDRLLGPMGDSDDTTTTASIVKQLREFPRKHFVGWNAEEDHVRYAWSGIMGFTPDDFPYVGAVPQRPKQWIAAGFNGHGESHADSRLLFNHDTNEIGMARAFVTLKALCEISRGKSPDPRVPKLYFDVAERLADKDVEWNTMLCAAERTQSMKSKTKLY